MLFPFCRLFDGPADSVPFNFLQSHFLFLSTMPYVIRILSYIYTLIRFQCFSFSIKVFGSYIYVSTYKYRCRLQIDIQFYWQHLLNMLLFSVCQTLGSHSYVALLLSFPFYLTSLHVCFHTSFKKSLSLWLSSIF